MTAWKPFRIHPVSNSSRGLRRIFADVRDPRVVGRCDHLLLDILSIVILATFCGADDWPEIDEFANCRDAWLKEFLSLPNGIPSHDTFRRVVEALDREQFSQSLFQWTRSLQQATEGILVAVDGKTLRSSGRKSSGIPNLHLVTAWAGENRLTLGQTACEDKSNEITAIPKLLELLDLSGAIVTIDAMGCQTEIAAQIRERKRDYVLGLKENQPGLLEEMEVLIEAAYDADFAGHRKTEVVTCDQSHGREVRQRCFALRVPPDHPQCGKWRGLRSVVVIATERVVPEGESVWETRCFISSCQPQTRKLARAIRLHWSVESSQHWGLGVAFAEDRRRQSARNAAANLAAIRRLANSILQQERSNKRGVKNKRLACGWDSDYLLKVLHNAKF